MGYAVSCLSGIIPAHAGFTEAMRRTRTSPGDHPRTRGVYVGVPASTTRAAGSSPHTRGLRRLGVGVGTQPGIIPAHAGFTRRRPCRPRTGADHPRTRGVYPFVHTVLPHHPGSSPHTRGLHLNLDGVTERSGIIPAHAGFTSVTPPSRWSSGDHPRTRGVYAPEGLEPPTRRGSSPHTRGLRPTRPTASRLEGIIPAHAGFTRPGVAAVGRRPDHPRTRGVYSTRVTSRTSRLGSSPHTRGLRWHAVRRPHQLGIIPAHAGFTLGDPWNPNGPGVYHPPVSFTADLVPARQSCGSAAVEPRWTTTPWAA